MSVSSDTHPVILVVEDEALVRSCLVMQLEDAGYDVIEAADAEQALRAFKQHDEVDIVFSDINMPGQFDGLSLVHQISNLRPQVQLILTSGRPRPAVSDMPAGIQFLPKPYAWGSLANLIKAA